MTKEFFARAFRLTFAGCLYRMLREPKLIGTFSFDRDPGRVLRSPRIFLEVRGRMRLCEHSETGNVEVGVRFLVSADWLSSLPIAFCDAHFIRQEVDWHIPAPARLCYAQDGEWAWQMDELWKGDASSDALIEAGSAWCIRNVDSLVTRHLHGSRYGISRWPREWGQWSHGDAGIREFEVQVAGLKVSSADGWSE